MPSSYIFIDTFALATLTKDHYRALSLYLYENDLQLVITPMLLVEYFNPVMQQGDRTENAVRLLMEHDFIIVNQDTIMDMEEAAYPSAVARLPITWNSIGALDIHDGKDRYELLYQLFHHGIPGTGFDLKTWSERHHVNKMSWKADVDAMLKHAMLSGTLGSKTEFVQSLDIRLCNGLEQAARQLKGQEKPDRLYPERVKKLDRIVKKHDTKVMKGIHLSSLITWYDYVVAHKAIKPSDMADIYHAIIYPYCAVVIADASRADVIQRIQREDRLYLNLKCFRLKEFLQALPAGSFDQT